MAKILILTGAGISVESGISTFNMENGLWEKHNIKEVCNFDSLIKNEEKTISFYDMLRADMQDKHPNNVHLTLASLKKKYPLDIKLVTQNIDDLFEKAGLNFNEVLHLHGFLRHVRCRDSNCKSVYVVNNEPQHKLNNGNCPVCGSKLRPNVVFLKEKTPTYQMLWKHLQDCQMFVVIGTSGKILPIDIIGKNIQYKILNNLEKSSYIDEKAFSKVYFEKATVAISKIKEDIENFLK
jgi:NAD-dependent deacetylase